MCTSTNFCGSSLTFQPFRKQCLRPSRLACLIRLKLLILSDAHLLLRCNSNRHSAACCSRNHVSTAAAAAFRFLRSP